MADFLGLFHLLANTHAHRSAFQMRQQAIFTVRVFDEHGISRDVSGQPIHPKSSYVGRTANSGARRDHDPISGRQDRRVGSDRVCRATALVYAGLPPFLALPHLLDARATEIHPEPTGDAQPFFTMPDRAILALGVVAMCVMIGEGAMADWSAVYLRNTLGTRESVAATGYAAFSIAMAGGRFFGDYLAARFGPVKMVRFGGGTAAMGLLLGLLFNHPAVALAGFACVGAGFATIVPMVFSAAGGTPGSPGVALASVTTTGYLGFWLVRR